MVQYHVLKFYFHGTLKGEDGEKNAHTYRVTLYLEPDQEQSFQRMEQAVKDYLKEFENMPLEDFFAASSNKLPLIECVGELFYRQLQYILAGEHTTLYQLEVSEDPLRTYIISNQILMPMASLKQGAEEIDQILEYKKRLLGITNQSYFSQ